LYANSWLHQNEQPDIFSAGKRSSRIRYAQILAILSFKELIPRIEKLDDVNRLLKMLGEDLEKISLLPQGTYAEKSDCCRNFGTDRTQSGMRLLSN
jgi:hypothetical protein